MKPVNRAICSYVPSPAACACQLLRFSQVALASQQGLLRAFACVDIGGASYEFDHISRGIQDRMAKDVDVSDHATGGKNAVFDFVVRLLNDRSFNATLPLFAVF